MTIHQIYERYQIPPNLQRHQLEVAAVGRYIGEHWKGSTLDLELITQALLLHDMGNIIKFKRPFLGELEKDATHWEEVQQAFIKKYGTTTSNATDQILNELQMREDVKKLVHALDATYLAANGYPDMLTRICNYADMCVAPEGIVGFKKRMEDLKERYGLKDYDEHFIRRRINADEVEKCVTVNLGKIQEVDFSVQIEELQHYSF